MSRIREICVWRAKGREQSCGAEAAVPGPMRSWEKEGFAPTVSCIRAICYFSIFALVGMGLALAAPSASGDVLLLSRNTFALGSANLPDLFVEGNGFQQTTGFGSADLTHTHDGSSEGYSGSGTLHVTSELSVDGTGTLHVSGTGTVSAEASGPIMGPIFADSSVSGDVIDLNFELTGGSYTVAVTGQASTSITPDSFTTRNDNVCALQITSTDDGIVTEYYSVLVGPNGVGFFPESASLPTGTLRLRAFMITLTRTGFQDNIQHQFPDTQTASNSLSFEVTITPDAPEPTPTPIQWNNPAGGSFQTATNWDPQTVPASGDTAVFGLQTAYSVDIGMAATERLEIRNGDVTFTNANYAVAATDFVPSGTLLDNSILTLASGSLSGIHMLIGESAAARVDVKAGAILNYTGSVQVGGPGNGILIINNGGQVLSGEGRIATGLGGGQAEVEGPGALWNSGSLAVGFFGGVEANLFVSGGAQLVSDIGDVGFSTGSDGAVEIADDQSKWTLSGDLKIGEGGTGFVNVLSGALVTCPNMILGISAFGDTRVEGFGTQPAVVEVAGQVTVGQSNTGSVSVVDGAETSAHDITAGAGPGSFGSITVAGKSTAGPSFLSAEQNIVLGLEGGALMSIFEDGVVTCFDAALGVFAGSVGRAELGIDSLAGDPARWVVNGNLTLGGIGIGQVALHNSANVTVGQTLFIEPNGSIGGNGTFSAQMVVRNSGGNGPGNSVGTLIIESDYEQTATGKLTIETTGIGEGEFDVLHVTGNATLDGTLEMLFPADYLPKAGDSFKFLEVDGTISGEFAEVTFPQLLPGFQFDMTQVSGGFVFTALNDAVLAPTFLLNISTRLQVGTDDNVLIGGFILQGTEPKTVLIRAIGPSLETAGVMGAIADPTLELHDDTGALIGQNDNWTTTQIGGVITDDQFVAIFTSGLPPANSAESAIIATLEPGAYTAIVAGADSSTGIGLAEVYDLGPAAALGKLANISTRGFVQTGDNVMIGGFIIGNQTSEVLVRGIGPSLTPLGVSGALADPTLDLHDGNGALLASNDNWRSDQETEIDATGLAPDDDAESAILQSLAPGAYTAILRGVADTIGVGLVEAYNLD